MGDAIALEGSKGIRSVISGENKIFYLEYPCHSPDEERWFMMRTTPFELNHHDYYVISHQNITERKLAENEVAKNLIELKKTQSLMMQQSRQAAMGEMVSMIAHQWRQPLTAMSAIIGTLSLELMMDNYKKEFFEERLNSIGELTQQLSSSINDFRNFYQPSKEAVTLTLKEVVLKTIKLIKSSLEDNNIEMLYEYNDMEKIKLYENEVVQVILNILKNAEDNFKEKKIKNPQIKITTQENSISICDNGGGIAENIIENIFDPYFSTKDEKNGTGLGLYMSKTIVEKHHRGKLHVNNHNDGVCFTIVLNT